MTNCPQLLPFPIWQEIFSYFFLSKELNVHLPQLRLVCRFFRDLITPFWSQRIHVDQLEEFLIGVNLFHFSVHRLKIRCDVKKNDQSSLPPYFGKVLNGLSILKFKKFFTDKDIPHLPTTLISLEIPYSSGVTVEGLRLLPQIKKLDLNYILSINDQVISCLPRSLTKLNLCYCTKITNEGLKLLPTSLTKLDLEGCKISDEGLSFLSKSITKLTLADCADIHNEGLKYLPMNLKSLNLSYNENITDIGISYLPKSLTHLNLDGCSLITNQGYQHLPTSLLVLYIEDTDILDQGIAALPRSLINLSLAQNLTFTPQGLKNLPPKLVALDLSETNITDQCFVYFPKTLTSLYLSNCKFITDEALKYLPPFLENLDLDQCSQITNLGISYLPTSLRELFLPSVDCVTDAGLTQLHSFPFLLVLEIDSQKSISGECFKFFSLDVQIYIQHMKMNPFVASIYFGNISSIKSFIEMGGVDINHHHLLGKSMLQLAKERCSPKIVDYLIEHGAR